MLGEYPGTPPLPSFWSDQHGLRVHYVGHASRADGVHLEGSPEERDFTAVYTRGGTPVAGVAVGGFIGWALDRWLGSAPFLMVVFLVLGAAAGIVNVIRAAKAMQAKAPPAGKDLPEDVDDED